MFDSATLDRIADVIAAAVIERVQPTLTAPASADGWMDSRAAADYLGMSPNALYKLTAARKVPFSQDVDGGKAWFQRSQLDAWRLANAQGPTFSNAFPGSPNAA